MPIFAPNAKTIQNCLEGIPDNLCREECVDLELPHYSVEQRDGVVLARDLGNTSLVVDGYGQGSLLGSEEA